MPGSSQYYTQKPTTRLRASAAAQPTDMRPYELKRHLAINASLAQAPDIRTTMKSAI